MQSGEGEFFRKKNAMAKKSSDIGSYFDFEAFSDSGCKAIVFKKTTLGCKRR